MSLKLSSSAFSDHGNIPDKYTCAGKNISPPLSWTDIPKGTRSLALVCDDPDAPAGTWDHWILFNLPATKTHIEEGITSSSEFEDGSRHGKNSWGRSDYGGPCPPSGRHRYFFKLFALDTLVNLPPGIPKSELEKSMRGHILAEAKIMGYYEKKQ